ncbi:MAG: site-specific integrase, partial [Methylococcales bacterium]
YYSFGTKEASVDWIKRLIHLHDAKKPKHRTEPEVVAFLSDLAVSGNLAGSTPNQALNTLCSLYKNGLERRLGEWRGAVRAKSSQKLPVLSSQADVSVLLKNLHGVYWLIASLSIWFRAAHYGGASIAFESNRCAR